LKEGIDRLEARGARGEACIVIRSWLTSATSPGGAPEDPRGKPTYHLATGELLRPTAIPGHFETMDGKRQFQLR
jgi:hypothetical protein